MTELKRANSEVKFLNQTRGNRCNYKLIRFTESPKII